jgi:hypothetical protein
MRVIAQTSIASGQYGCWSEGEAFELPDAVALDWIRVGHAKPARTAQPEFTVSPLHRKAEKAVRHERR